MKETNGGNFIMDHLVQSSLFRGSMYAASAGLIVAGALGTAAEFIPQEEPTVTVQESELAAENSFDIGKVASPLQFGLGVGLAITTLVASEKARRREDDDGSDTATAPNKFPL